MQLGIPVRAGIVPVIGTNNDKKYLLHKKIRYSLRLLALSQRGEH
jgi:hypothetical protein